MSQTIQVSLDDQGHILIPAALRRRLGLSPGMTLVVEEAGNRGVRLRVQPETPTVVNKEGVLVVRAEPLSELTGVTQRERDCRISDLIQRVCLV